MKALKKMTSCNDLGKEICTGSRKTFLRYPRNPPQIKLTIVSFLSPNRMEHTVHQELTCYRLVFGLLRFFKHLCDPKTFKGSLQKKKCWFWDIVSISFPLPPLGPIETFLIETFLVLFNPSPRKPLEHFCSQGWKPYITFLYLGLEAPGTSL